MICFVFPVLSVYPTFNEAYDVLLAANESQNFIQLLLDCQKYWRRHHASESPISDGQARGNQTAALFDSPDSTLSNYWFDLDVIKCNNNTVYYTLKNSNQSITNYAACVFCIILV